MSCPRETGESGYTTDHMTQALGMLWLACDLARSHSRKALGSGGASLLRPCPSFQKKLLPCTEGKGLEPCIAPAASYWLLKASPLAQIALGVRSPKARSLLRVVSCSPFSTTLIRLEEAQKGPLPPPCTSGAHGTGGTGNPVNA